MAWFWRDAHFLTQQLTDKHKLDNILRAYMYINVPLSSLPDLRKFSVMYVLELLVNKIMVFFIYFRYLPEFNKYSSRIEILFQFDDSLYNSASPAVIHKNSV